MEEELLRKEREFHEINKKLENRTRELLQQVDNIKKHKDDFLIANDTTNNLQSALLDLQPRSRSAAVLQNGKSFQLSAQELKDLNIPADINNVGSRGFIQILKTKTRNLQHDLDNLSNEHKNKCEEVKKLQKDNLKLQEDKEKWLHNANVHKIQNSKLENQLQHIESKLKSREGENGALKRELETVNKDLRQAKSGSQHSETRVQKLLEELDQFKTAIKSKKHEEKDMRENHRRHTQELEAIIKRLEKQKFDLLTGYKKQLLLVDNLKKQKNHLEGCKLNEKVEKDFLKLLSWRNNDDKL